MSPRTERALKSSTVRILAFSLIVVVAILGGFVALIQHERQTERHQRTAAIALASKVQERATDKIYHSQLASCERGISVRLAVRANAEANAKVYRVLGSFLKGARPRALAQSEDPNISAKSRVAAKASLTSIDNGIAALSVHIAIPPPPLPCDEVITDPNAPALPHHS